MNIGMLWFDNDRSADLPKKIERASKYYYQKYGKHPNFCYIHPSLAPSDLKPAEKSIKKDPENELQNPEAENDADDGRLAFQSGGLEVRTSQTVLPNHLWIGINGHNGANGGHA